MLVGALSALPAAVRAQNAVPARVSIILATELPGVIDPRIADIPALRRPPFDRYSSMTLLSSPEVRLQPGQPQVVDLPNGRRLRLELQERTEEGRYRLQVSVNRPGEQDYLPAMRFVAAPGSPIFIAGQSFQAGTLVIGIQLAR